MEMSVVLSTLLALLLCAVDLCLGAETDPVVDVEYYTERCLDGKYHKDKPGPESDLFNQCGAWKDRSCCTDQITEDLHLSPSWHDFKWNHCEGNPLSPTCEAWMRQDLCFYECSPNVGPWLVPHNISIRNERFSEVPLCQSECNIWFEACRYDYTCKENWAKGWDWSSGENECPAGSTCQTFETVFGNATNMCQKIWNKSYTVAPDTESCMVLWFDSTNVNPNEEVALEKAVELVGGRASPSIYTPSLLPLILASIAATLSTTWQQQ